MKPHWHKIAAWGVAALVVAVFMVIATGPDFISVPFGEEGSRARLMRDDHELGVFFDRGSWLPDGLTPYDASIFQEYPQVGLAYITAPFVAGEDFGSYRWGILALNLLSYLGLIYVTYRLLKKLGRSPWLLWLLVLPSMLYFSFSRFDIFVALIVQLSLWLLIQKKYRWSVVFLALAFLTKWYPLLFLPLYFLYLKNTVSAEKFRGLIKKLLCIFGGIVGVVMLSSFIVDGFASLRPYIFHSSRPGGVGSLYHIAIQGPLLSTGIEQLNYLGLTIFLLLQFSVPIYLVVKSKVIQSYVQTPQQLLTWAALAVMAFTFFSRFYSPQWVIWFVPMLLLIVPRRWIWVMVVFDILNYLSFPLIWQVWGPFSAGYVGVSIALIALLAVLLWRIFRLILAKNKIAQMV